MAEWLKNGGSLCLLCSHQAQVEGTLGPCQLHREARIPFVRPKERHYCPLGACSGWRAFRSFDFHYRRHQPLKLRVPHTSASRPTKVYGWKFTHHRWMSNHYLENQPLFGKPTTLWLEILPPSQPHRYHNSALYILFDKGKVEENSSP